MLSKKQKILAVALVSALAVPVGSNIIKEKTMVTTFYAATEMKTTENLNVRSGPGTNYKKVTTLSKGAKVKVHSYKGDWANITYNGSSKGYVSKKYLTSTSVSNNSSSSKKLYTTNAWSKSMYKLVTVKSSTANVRNGCSTSSSVVDKLSKGTKVYADPIAYNNDGTWYMIRYNVTSKGCNYGYVHQSVLNV